MKYLILTLILFVNYTFAEEKFKVGVILPLTGVTADYGEAVKNGIELARKQQPEKFTNIKFVYEDALYKGSLAVQAFNKLRAVDKVDLLYAWGVIYCKALAPLTEKYQLPFIAQSVDPTIAINKDYIIRFTNYTDEYARAMLEFLRAKGVKKYAAVLTENAYLEETFEAYRRNVKTGESIDIVERYQHAQADFRSAIIKIKKNKHQAVLVYLAPGQAASFTKQAKELGLELPIVGTNLFESQSEIEASAGAMNGSYLANNIVSKEFQQQYFEAYNSDTQITFAGYAYEFASLIGDLFNKEERLKNTEIIKKFENINNKRAYAMNRYQYMYSKHIGKYIYFPIAIKQIRNGYLSTLRLE